MQRLTRFARYWDLIANSGRFPSTLTLILGDAPFARFLSLADWLYAETRQTHQIALDRLYDLVHAGLVTIMGCSSEAATQALARDYAGSGARGAPAFLKQEKSVAGRTEKTKAANQATRQLRHLAS